jgi:hypothetical protein
MNDLDYDEKEHADHCRELFTEILNHTNGSKQVPARGMMELWDIWKADICGKKDSAYLDILWEWFQRIAGHT